MNIPDDLQAGYVPKTVLNMPEKRAEPEPEPLPEPEPEPVPEPEPEPAPAPETLDMAPQEKKGGKTGLVIGLVVALLLAAALVWFFVLRDKGDGAPAEAEKEPAGPVVTGKVSVPDQAPASVPFLAQARDHLKGTADPAKSLELAAPMRTENADESSSDGAFLLIEDAAQKGEARAMYLLGQFYDPANTLPKGTIQPDAGLAIDWYRKAQSAGIPEAADALSALKTHLEGRAAAGDAEAARLLGNF